MTTCDGNDEAPARLSRAADPSHGEPIAVVGIGCRFPGRVIDPGSFWTLLESSSDAITEIPPDRWALGAFYDPDPSRPGKIYTRWGGFIDGIDGIDRFDADFFGISPREAARMDPQQRILLEVAHEALEDAGMRLEKIAGSRTAVFVGISSFDYSVLETSFRDRGTIDAYCNTGGSLSIAANRISYCFDVHGPSAAIDTACSSALVAVHLACRAIWHDGCPMALAGGVNALLLPDWYVGFCRMGMLSPDGRCKAFDAAAAGFVRSEGAGIIALKPLAQALADGDRVYAVIRGSATNQDGRTPGMTVPSQEAQESVLREACHSAGVSPSSIQYVEAHGTGTPVGDPIEARALGSVLSIGRPEQNPCLIGSVKTNIGHLEAGAGIAGLIKVALALHHRRIPANLHFKQPSSEIDWRALRLRVPTSTEPWPDGDGPALAGVNAFGFGGTNAHVVLQEAPRAIPTSTPFAGNQSAASPVEIGAAHAWLVPLSARGPEALTATAQSWDQYLAQCPDDVSLEEIAVSASARRSHHDHRLAVVAHSKLELATRLRDYAQHGVAAGVADGRAPAGRPPRIAFICSGQGPQWWAMGRQLLNSEPAFRASIERCAAIVERLADWSLLDELAAPESRSRMDETAVSQPCIFALQVGLAELWASWGVRPEALAGHSVGEVAAAFLAGVFSLEDAVRIIYHRARSMSLAREGGRMLAAGISADAARQIINPYGDRVTLAAVNSPASVTLSGESAALEELAALLEERRFFSRFLRVQYAFHSAQMDPIRDDLLAALEGIEPRAASVPMFSTVTGQAIAGPELVPEYWWNNVRRTVRFADGVERLIEHGCDTVIELSAHPALAAAVTECHQSRGQKATVLPSLRRQEDERATMLFSLGSLYALGHPIDWAAFSSGPRRFIRLPLYPWQRERFWHEADESRVSRLSTPAHPLLGVAQGEPRPAWEARLDLRLYPYLADHRVQHAAIMPAAAYLEVAFAAGREAFGAIGCELREIAFANPCFLAAEKPLRLKTTLDPDTGRLQVYTHPVQGDDEWTVHLTAAVNPRTAGPDEIPFSFEAMQKRCPREYMHGECYDYLRELGLDYGPAFRGIERIWQGDRESLGLVALVACLEQESDAYLFPPALLDACLQVIAGADGEFTEQASGLYLPHDIAAVRLFRRPGRRVWVHARLLEKTPQRSSADLDIYNEDGRSVATVRALRGHRVAGGRKESIDDLLYADEWHPLAQSEPDTPPERASWLIFADKGGMGTRLACELRARGNTCAVVHAGPAFEECGEEEYRINPDRPEDMFLLIQAAAAFGRAPSHGVVHLWNLGASGSDGQSANGPIAGALPGLLSVVWLVQALERTAPEMFVQLFLVTRGAQSVLDRGEPVAVAQAPILGLGRVIASECARLRTKLVDLDPGAIDGGLDTLLQDIRCADEEDEVAWRGTERYVRRYVPTPGVPAALACGPAEPDVSYKLAVRQPGTLDGLVLESSRRRQPGPGEVEIEVVAAGVNFSDVMKALGLYPGLPDGPVPLGAECSGRITSIGEGVSDLRTGDEVLAVAGFAFGSHVVTRAELVAVKPARLSFEQAATLPIAFLTACYALEYLAHLAPGERVLIHSASGGVGLAAIQLARRAGAEVFATAGTPEKREYLRALGIQCVADSRSLDFAEVVMAHTLERGVDVILNSLPGAAISRGISILTDYGRFLEIGKRDIYQNARLALEPFRKNLSFYAIDLDRVIRERPGLLGTMLRDIVRRVDAGELEPLPVRSSPISEVVESFRFMQHGHHIGKIALTFRDSTVATLPAEDEPITFRADGSYLITGGLGGFGMAVARWMAERGAGTLVLCGRRGADTPDARQAISQLEQLGARVVVHAADVSKESSVAAVLAAIDRDLPPLRGVLHAAMVLDDALVINLDRRRMQTVLAPKLRGAWNLHAQTADRPLDFFIMFSSIASVFGHAGQANYAAANAFLDALAWYRRGHGLRALAVNWGHLGEVGYIARHAELAERLERQGILSLTVRQALAGLERAIARQHVQVSVMRADWSRWRGLGVTGRVSPRFAHLFGQADVGRARTELASPHAREMILAADSDGRAGLLDTLVRDKVASVLGTSPDRLDGDRPLLQLGVDSLMAVELRNWLEGELQVDLPIVALMRSPSVSGLVELLAERLQTVGKCALNEATSNGAASGPVHRRNGKARTVLQETPSALRARTDDLSGEQVDALLIALLEEKSSHNGR